MMLLYMNLHQQNQGKYIDILNLETYLDVFRADIARQHHPDLLKNSISKTAFYRRQRRVYAFCSSERSLGVGCNLREPW